VNNRPDLPGTHTRAQQVVLDLVDDDGNAIAVHDAQIREEYCHEDGTPDKLVEEELLNDGDGFLALDPFVEPVVEEMSRRTVVRETEEGEGDEPLPVEWTGSDEDLIRAVGGSVWKEGEGCWRNVSLFLYY